MVIAGKTYRVSQIYIPTGFWAFPTFHVLVLVFVIQVTAFAR